MTEHPEDAEMSRDELAKEWERLHNEVTRRWLYAAGLAFVAASMWPALQDSLGNDGWWPFIILLGLVCLALAGYLTWENLKVKKRHDSVRDQYRAMKEGRQE